jgi:hemerythrin superfamily protein
MPEASQRLSDDHLAIDSVLKDLKTALEWSDVETSHAKLDLFWARLAVHIRAEHLHLFPTVMTGLREKTSDDQSKLALMAADAAIDQLREDHNFFMRELSDAIQTIRTLGKISDKRIDLDGLEKVQTAVLEIERRLVRHNALEENKVYRWAGLVLSEQKQIELAMEIDRELANRPPRFSAETWQHS